MINIFKYIVDNHFAGYLYSIGDNVCYLPLNRYPFNNMKIESRFDAEGHIFYNLIHESGDCITTISGVTTDEIQLI